MASKKTKLPPPASTVEAREEEMVNLATNLAEQKLRDGTATSALILHYLKAGSVKERKQVQILSKQEELISAKTESLQLDRKKEDLYEDVISSLKDYRGETYDEYDEEDF